MQKSKIALLILFSALLLTFVLFSAQITFHDTREYITVAKELAGIHNVNVHSGHSFVYTLYLSFFIKLVPSMQAIKVANALWLVAIAALLLIGAKSFKPFLLFAASPLVWWLSPQITPVLPAAFFITLAYLSIKTFESRAKTKWLALAGLSLGLSFAFYEPMILPIALLIFFFFYEKSFKLVIFTAIFTVLGVLPRLALDYYLFRNPLYSIIRYVGSNVAFTVGMKGGYLPLQPELVAAVLFMITPFLLIIYKIDWKKYLRECLWLLILFIVLTLRSGHWHGIKYFLIITPIFLLLLATSISRKQLMFGILASIAITGFMAYGFFGETSDAILTKDMQDISVDGYKKLVSSGGGTAYAAYLFGNVPFIFWQKEYDAATENKTTYSDLDYKLMFSRINLLEQLEMQATLNAKPNDFSGAKFMFEKTEKVPAGFGLEKCYRAICVYRKVGGPNG